VEAILTRNMCTVLQMDVEKRLQLSSFILCLNAKFGKVKCYIIMNVFICTNADISKNDKYTCKTANKNIKKYKS